MTPDYQTILNKILESCRTKAKWNNDDRKLLKSFRESLGSPTEVAHALQVSTASLYAWEKQFTEGNKFRPPPPEKQLEKFSMLIAEKHLGSLLGTRVAGEPKPVLYDVLMRMRSVPDMMQRAAVCDRFWALRSGRPFVAANDPTAMQIFLKFMKETTTEFYFAYRVPEVDEVPGSRLFRAMESFKVLKKKVAAESASLSNRIHECPIQTQQVANELGLVDPWISYVMAEYSSEGREAFQKSVDVWMEFIFDVSKDAQVERKQLVWLELPGEEAEKWREKRSEFWKAAI
jgi:transposase-like protein